MIGSLFLVTNNVSSQVLAILLVYNSLLSLSRPTNFGSNLQIFMTRFFWINIEFMTRFFWINIEFVMDATWCDN